MFPRLLVDCFFSHSGCLVLLVGILCRLGLVTNGCVCVQEVHIHIHTFTCLYMLALCLLAYMLFIFNTLDMLSIGGYVLSLYPPKTSKSNKLHYGF